MNILVTGNVSQISEAFFKELPSDAKYVVIDQKHSNKFLKIKGVKITSISVEHLQDDANLDKVFKSYMFDSVVFFSYTLNESVKVFDELEKLESVVYISRRYKVNNFIYVLSNDAKGDEASDSAISRDILMSSCMNLCQSVANEHQIHFKYIVVPYLYSTSNVRTPLYKWVTSAWKKENIKFRGNPDNEIDFLAEEDLGVLVSRLIDDMGTEYFEYLCVSGGNVTTLKTIIEKIEKKTGKFDHTFMDNSIAVPKVLKNDVARNEYGWVPVHIFLDELNEIIHKAKEKDEARISFWERHIKDAKTRERLRGATELICLFAITLVLNYLIRNNSMLNFIDLRLVFVVIIGAMNGLVMGVGAAILASISYVVGKSADTNWQIILYNVENWLPFACYFLLGSITGYNKDKTKDELQFANEQMDILNDKYSFLNKLYNEVLVEKEQLNQQIIGYDDSYGKLYAVVKKLDSFNTNEIFFEAVESIGEILNSNSVAIFSFSNDSSFARLIACSKNWKGQLAKSIRMNEQAAILDTIKAKQIFKNTNCIPNFPQYVAPLFKGDQLIGMVAIIEAEPDQFNMDFVNKFTIISSLVQDSLARAMDFEAYEQFYIPGTNILTAEKLAERIEINSRMKEKQFGDFILARVLSDDSDLLKKGQQVSDLIRANDAVGMGSDGSLYVIYSQTDASEIHIIEERFNRNGIHMEIIRS